MTSRIAVVAAACEFPESRTPQELWQTALHGRRCFRRLPAERLALADYASAGADGIGKVEAALLEGWRFDRERFRVPKSAYERTDLAHWLALEVATRALEQLSPASVRAERDSAAVIVANTLTGEFSRAYSMRYRWPFVERKLRAAAASRLGPGDTDDLVRAFEAAYKHPFPAPDEDSLAGGLSNTIAGRIANHHGLRGGAFAVDGACASGLLAVVTACDRLAGGDAGCVLVGAVDLSLDPFELVGFARNGALAPESMRVFDAASAGFWPGEGCGFVMLATEEVAARHRWPALAWLRGAAMSADGEGALTRPTAEGQLLASRRAWKRAGLDPARADYFEAHGTGTPTGDPVELSALAELIGEPLARPIPVGSIKANIGHTKAAAGMAGLLKAIAVCRERTVPATAGCGRPHPLLGGEVGRRVQVRRQAERLDHDRPAVAGVSSFGFGGINCHVVVQGPDAAPPRARDALPPPDRSPLPGELFMLHAPTRPALAALLARLAQRARTLSHAQLLDLAASLGHGGADPGWRASVAADTPASLAGAAAAALSSLEREPAQSRCLGELWSWSAPAAAPARIAWLFPGQGLPIELRPEPWEACFPVVADAAQRARTLAALDRTDTAVVQPLQAEVALAGMALLRSFGLRAAAVLGHSFGELSALHAAGCIDAPTLRMLAAERGRCQRDRAPRGAMLSLHAARAQAIALAQAHDLDLACENAPERIVVAGSEAAIDALAADCAVRGIRADRLVTTRAFHSRSMSASAAAFAPALADLRWQPAQCPVVSTITGRPLDGESLPDLLVSQLTAPVRFAGAVQALAAPDLVVEVGAAPALAGLVASMGQRALCIDVFGESLLPLLHALGAAWVCGAQLDRDALIGDRLVRPCRLDDEPLLLANPCGATAGEPASVPAVAAAPEPPAHGAAEAPLPVAAGTSPLDALRGVLAELTGLSADRLEPKLRLLTDLHLNSIRARHAIALTARRLGLAQLPFDLGRLANASLQEAARALGELRSDDHPAGAGESLPPSIEPWLRLLRHAWADAGPAATQPPGRRSLELDDALAPLGDACRSLLDCDAEQTAAPMLLLVLPTAQSPAVGAALLRAAQRVAGDAGAPNLLVLQHAQLANAFMRSVAAEQPQRRICVVEVERTDPMGLATALAEFDSAERGYAELRLRGARVERRTLQPLAARAPEPPLTRWAPSADEVVVVSGGARGIGAVTAQALARRWRCRLALIGRSAIGEPEVASTLSALRAAGAQAHYFQADLTDPAQARVVAGAIRTQLGPVRALFHAAGINRPRAIASLDAAELATTLAAKVDTLNALLDALPAAPLRLVVGYASIIGELGLTGEAHYALANEWLDRSLARLAESRPHCRVLSLAWSAWAEAGMAKRLEGVLDGLALAGARALASDEAVSALERLLDSAITGKVVVTGRYGRAVDDAERRRLQRHRYLEQPRVFYPGVELVADAVLCSDFDRYLLDHAPFGVPVLPLVCAVEAMVSAAQCLWGSGDPPAIEALTIGDALGSTPGQRFVVRVSALVAEDGTVRAEIRSQTTRFEKLHFAARLVRVPLREADGGAPAEAASGAGGDAGAVGWPAAELLYRGLVFHGPRLQRLGRVAALSATHCEVQTVAGLHADWYGPLLPQGFAAGDSGVRDAALHALQLCLPHQVVLPIGVERVCLGRLDAACAYRVAARQTASDGRRFVFDLSICSSAGQVVERWQGLTLQTAAAAPQAAARLATPLLRSLIERLAGDTLAAPDVVAGVAVGRHGDASARALACALGRPTAVGREPDGALAAKDFQACSSHAGDITVALASPEHRVAIDLQFARDEIDLDAWKLMLNAAQMGFATRLVERGITELPQALLAAWTAAECLVKLGRGDALPDAGTGRVEASQLGPVVSFRSAGVRLAVALLAVDDAPAALALAIESERAEPRDAGATAAVENVA